MDHRTLTIFQIIDIHQTQSTPQRPSHNRSHPTLQLLPSLTTSREQRFSPDGFPRDKTSSPECLDRRHTTHDTHTLLGKKDLQQVQSRPHSPLYLQPWPKFSQIGRRSDGSAAALGSHAAHIRDQQQAVPPPRSRRAAAPTVASGRRGQRFQAT